MDCPEMSQISIVWNNNVSVETANIINPKWVRPIYFVQTPYNSMDFRFMIPKQSKAQVYFSIDDDTQISCEGLQKSFSQWRKNAVGDLGPLVGFGPCGFDFDGQKQQYKDNDLYSVNYYSSVFIGISWVSRFYLQLYNSLESNQIKRIRKIVKEKNNCDDIAMNHIINFFFPEFFSQRVYLSYKFQERPKGQKSQSLLQTSFNYRCECWKQFNEIFGFNPLRHIYTKRKQELLYKSLTKQYSIYLKKKQLTEKMNKKQSSTWIVETNNEFSQFFPNINLSLENIEIQQFYLRQQINTQLQQVKSSFNIRKIYYLLSAIIVLSLLAQGFFFFFVCFLLTKNENLNFSKMWNQRQ